MASKFLHILCFMFSFLNTFSFFLFSNSLICSCVGYTTKAEVLAAIVSNPYQQFLSSWCSSELPLKEEDALLEYEPYTMAGLILDLSSTLDTTNAKIYEPNIIPINNAQTSYAHQRTSLLVKVIANLHCFVPKICKG